LAKLGGGGEKKKGFYKIGGWKKHTDFWKKAKEKKNWGKRLKIRQRVWGKRLLPFEKGGARRKVGQKKKKSSQTKAYGVQVVHP